MGLTSNINPRLIREQIAERNRRYRAALLMRLRQAGEHFVRIAREKTKDQGGFMDQTGNLRSSIGYIILHNGQPVYENFKIVKEGSEGLNKGKSTAQSQALRTLGARGYVLVVVAGMNYAAAVEKKGHDVITGTSLVMETWLKSTLARLKAKAF